LHRAAPFSDLGAPRALPEAAQLPPHRSAQTLDSINDSLGTASNPDSHTLSRFAYCTPGKTVEEMLTETGFLAN
jgi:hypothetical protein